MHLDVENMQDQLNIQNETPHNILSPLQEIGRLIRKAREERNLSIEDLAGSLRIGQEQLIALENAEEDLLPEKVFIKAMIRRVSERLHLDLGLLINEFKTDENLHSSTPNMPPKSIAKHRNNNKTLTWVLVVGLLGITTSVFAITYFKIDFL